MFWKFLEHVGLRKSWPLFTREEIAEHNTEKSLWIVADGSVYDVTSILSSHPGGETALLRRGGGITDCSRDFMFHSYATRRSLYRFKIGEIASSPTTIRSSDNTTDKCSCHRPDVMSTDTSIRASDKNGIDMAGNDDLHNMLV